MSASLSSRKQQGARVLVTAPLAALPRQPGRQLRTCVACSSQLQQLEAVVQQRAAEVAAPAAAAAVQAPRQPEQAPAERWMPASWLSGWKGTGSLLLSFGAVAGGSGLMGARGAGQRRAPRKLCCL